MTVACVGRHKAVAHALSALLHRAWVALQVEKGKRYRFRTIQGAASWGFKVQPLNHTMTIIAVDGANTAPTPAKGFIVNAGERVDFILKADQPVRGVRGPGRAALHALQHAAVPGSALVRGG